MQAQISKMTIEYLQDGDSANDDIQLLEITTDDAGAGVYYVLRTERWAIDNMEEFLDILNDFEKRLKIK